MALIFHSLFVKILNVKTNLNKFKCVSSSLNFCLINFLLKTFLALSIYHQILLNSLNLHRKKIFLLNKTPEYIYISNSCALYVEEWRWTTYCQTLQSRLDVYCGYQLSWEGRWRQVNLSYPTLHRENIETEIKQGKEEKSLNCVWYE